YYPLLKRTSPYHYLDSFSISFLACKARLCSGACSNTFSNCCNASTNSFLCTYMIAKLYIAAVCVSSNFIAFVNCCVASSYYFNFAKLKPYCNDFSASFVSSALLCKYGNDKVILLFCT